MTRMLKYLAIIFVMILSTNLLNAQLTTPIPKGGWTMPNRSAYGTIQQRISIGRVFNFPTGDFQPEDLDASDLGQFAMYGDSATGKVWFYNPKTKLWSSLEPGSNGNCDSVVSQVEAFPDSSGYWGFNCNGDTILEVTYYSDEGGGGTGGNTLSATQTFTGDGDTYDFTILTPNINNFSAPVYLDYKPGDELPPTQGANSVTLHYNLPPPAGQAFTVKIIYTISAP